MFFPLFQQKIQILPDLPLQSLNLRKISLPKPPIWPKFSPIFFQKFSSLSPIFSNNQFFQPQFFVPFRSLSPHLRPFGQNTYTKIKVEYPPGSAPCPHIGYAPGAKLGESVFCWACIFTKYIQNMMDTVGLLKERTWKTHIGVEGL